MRTYLSCCHWPWCCLVCELHRKFFKFHIIRCDHQDVVAGKLSIPIQCLSSNFLNTTRACSLKRSFSRTFLSPHSSLLSFKL